MKGFFDSLHQKYKFVVYKDEMSHKVENAGINKKRALICLPFFSLGGAETQAFYLADYLQNKANVDVEVWAFSPPGLLSEKLSSHNIKWRYYPLNMGIIHSKGYSKVSCLLKLGLALRKEKFDVLFPFTYYPNVFLSAVWRFTKAKKCFWNQRGLERLSVNAIEKLAMLQRPSYLANSIACKEFIQKRHNLKSSQVAVIHNGYSMPKDSTHQSQQKNSFNILMVANYFPEKDQGTVIKAFSVLSEKDKNDNMKLFLVGKANQNDAIEKFKSLAFDLNLTGKVVFLDSTSKIPELIESADITILSSTSEGCSNSITEYMGHAKPVIATDIPANRELLGNDYPYFFKPFDKEQLVRHLESLMNSEEKRKACGEANKVRVETHYSLESMEHSYLKLIKQLFNE